MRLACIPLTIVLLGATARVSAVEICDARETARRLRADADVAAALVTLGSLALTNASPQDAAAVRLDRAELLLDLWRTGEARNEIASTGALLALASTEPGGGSCGEGGFESALRAAELAARATRVDGRYEQAADAWTVAIAARRTQQPLHAPALVRALNLAGEAFWLADRLGEMSDVYREAVARAEALEPPDEALLARAIEGRGMHASARGDFEDAERFYERALEHYRRAGGDLHPVLAGLWLSIGSMAADRADLLSADAAYQQAATILEPVTDPSLASDKATLALNLGSTDARFGRVDDARARFEEAKRLWTETRGPGHPHIAWADEELASLLEGAGRWEEADKALASAADLRERAAPGRPIALATAARLAALRARSGQPAAARALWSRIDASLARLTNASPFFLANIATRRAETAEAEGDLLQAERFRLEAEGVLARQLPAGHPGLADVRGQRARIAWLRGRRRDARQMAQDAWRVQRRVVGETVASLPESDAFRYLERSRELRDLLLCAAAGVPSLEPSALDATMRELAASRALVSGVLHERVPAASSVGPAEAEESAALASARRRYASLLWQPVSAVDTDYAPELAKARRVLEEIERRGARRASPDVAPRAAAPDPDPWDALEPGDALVAFGRYRCPASPRARGTADGSGYVAFVRRAGRPARVVRFPDGAALDRAVSDWYDQVASAVYAPPTEAQDELVDASGRALARMLWAPLAAAVGDADRVFVVPDGSLHSVSWYALPGASGRYLLDEPRLVHVLTAESDLWRRPAAEGGTARDVVVLADPLVARASTAVADASIGEEARQLRSACRFVDPQRLPRLEAAIDEARDVEERARVAGRSVRVAIGSAASESWLRAQAPSASILHLAAHGGELSPESCREAAEPAAAPAQERVRTLWAEAVRARPLMRTGLLLTGAAGFTPLDAPGTDDDGVLVAEEAARLDLRNADWVVLSACGTRRGPVVDSEGALGLHRAFHGAGARTVIASLWDVQDAPARRFMDALYAARLRDGRSTAVALRDAQRAVLGDLRARGRSTHPVQWAAFVASGDWR